MAKENKGKAIAGLVLGIVGVIFSWVPILNFILGILALIFSGLSLSKKEPGRGMAIAGLILGIVTLVISVILVIIAIAVVGTLGAFTVGLTA